MNNENEIMLEEQVCKLKCELERKNRQIHNLEAELKMFREKDNQAENLKYACEKVVALLRHDNFYNPHTTVIIKQDEIKVVSDEIYIPLK